MRLPIFCLTLLMNASLVSVLFADPAGAQERVRAVEMVDRKPEKPFRADADYVVLQGLDKETALILTVGGRVGETVRFRTLQIVIRRCQRTPPDQPPEKAAFLQIYDVNSATKEKSQVFSGWMFKSKPALSAMDHAIYDVWVKDCR
ncbi:MAG: DUF2155 domain-containing protein [Rhodospirillaceae bacterium]|nr:DUF2155 domain-containing protein [Rhodospirillaceae bacterium]